MDTGLPAQSLADPLRGPAARDSLAEKPAPTKRRKLAFWLLVGMLSVVCVEVPAGSTMFPFFEVWGLLVVWPLYLLHSVLLAGIVFRLGRPGFWPLYSAGMLYGLYEAYITKVIWVSFRPEGPFFTVGGIALFETLILVLFLHPLLAFVVPLLITELALTRSTEIFRGLPTSVRASVGAHPLAWACGLMTLFGLMQFVNSPSIFRSLLSGLSNGIVAGLAVFWWRRSGGTEFSMRELLPGPKGLKVFGGLLLAWYAFWGLAIKPKSVPSVLQGQLTVWMMYVVAVLILTGALLRSRAVPCGKDEPAFSPFSWRSFSVCVLVGTVVTTLARLWLYRFAGIQVLIFFSCYTVVGLLLLLGATLYALRDPASATE